MKKINIHGWKANRKFSWRQLIPAVSVCRAIYLFWKTIFILILGYFPKIMLDNSKPFGWWNMGFFVTNIIADYVGTDFPKFIRTKHWQRGLMMVRICRKSDSKLIFIATLLFIRWCRLPTKQRHANWRLNKHQF
jgi:hypothetical protein